MATIHEMGEVNETDSNEETTTVGASVNGDISCDDGDTRETQNSTEHLNCDDDNSVPAENLDSSEEIEDDAEKMDVDEINSEDDGEEIQEIDNSEDEEIDDENVQNGLNTPDETQINMITDDPEHSNEQSIVINDSAEEIVELEDKDAESALDKEGVETVDDNNDLIEVIDDNRDPIEVFDDNKGFSDNGSVNDSGDDVVISDTVDNDEVINLEDEPETGDSESRRRSSRNVSKLKKQYSEDEVISNNVDDSEESDIEEVLPEDPLAVVDDHPVPPRSERKKTRISSSTIVVKDTKCLAEIASKSTSNSNSKKEPTLVIIDTNSILSGRGPVPIAQKTTTSTTISNSHPIMPMALPAQGVYPANMRATITPIPMTSTTTKPPQQPSPAPLAPVLPTLSDDMFVVEAPSFIVPYVYEKPPIKDLQQFIKDLSTEIAEQKSKDNKSNSKECGGGDKLKNDEDDEQKDKNELDAKNETDKDSNDEDDEDKSNIDDLLTKKSNSYFDGPLGKFFMGIGYGLVQEMVQADLLRQQKRKREREGNQNPETTKTINSLIKNLEFTKENNEPYHMATKKCEFCTFKTESSLVMSYHLETPHMKNFIYRCNFCSYEVRSPHDILVHIEVLHGIRGRLERAPCYHQCPNCPFEDNQKGKLSRHLVSCARKFKPERNLEPLADFEPPAKIPRAPRMKQQSLGNAAAVYQAMARNPQFQMMSKMSNNMSALQRNRGRPTLGTSIKPSSIRPATNIMYKAGSMSGGSVLVPTNYQLSGNQLYQNQSNKAKNSQQPSISITPLPRGSTTSGVAITKMGDSNSKTSFVICEICDGYIKDLEQLRNHMQWIHKVKIHPKMINNRPPLNCQKCQFRFFTDQGLERHLLGSHGLVTSSMQEAANKSKDAGRCPVCGRVYQWKLLNHVARDHNMTLKPAHLSYKCTVCTATFGMYKQFESHVYSAHSVVAKRVMDKKGTSTSTASSKNESVLKPLKINDEITIIPQPSSSSKPTNGTGSSKEGSPSITTIRSGYSNGTPTTSKILGDGTSSSLPRFDRFITTNDIAK